MATLRQPRLFAHFISSKMQCSTQTNKPVVAAKMPFRVKVTGGKRYVWCACGYSKKQPFCDGAHRTKAPSISPRHFTPEKDSTLMLCTCPALHSIHGACHRFQKAFQGGACMWKVSLMVHLWTQKKQPFCDGTHKTKTQGLMPQCFIPEKDSKTWLCGCKYTANSPYWDSTHKQEFIQSALLPENTDS